MTGVDEKEGRVGGKVTEWPHSKYIITDFNDFSGAITC